MTTLTTDQGLILPTAGDPANVPTTFTAFAQSPAASSVESRLVKRYLSAADRTSRNATPQTGELSFRLDALVYEWYNGTAWVPLQKGKVTDLTRNVSNAGFTAETVQDFVTFTSLGTTTEYKLTVISSCQTTVANDLVRVRLRWQTGASLTTAGTLFFAFEVSMPLANRNFPCVGVKTISGIAAGNTSIGVTMERGTGTGTLTSAANGTTSQVYTLLEIV